MFRLAAIELPQCLTGILLPSVRNPSDFDRVLDSVVLDFGIHSDIR